MNQLTKIFLLFWIPICVFIVFNCSITFDSYVSSGRIYHGWEVIIIPIILLTFFTVVLFLVFEDKIKEINNKIER